MDFSKTPPQVHDVMNKATFGATHARRNPAFPVVSLIRFCRDTREQLPTKVNKDTNNVLAIFSRDIILVNKENHYDTKIFHQRPRNHTQPD